METPVLDIAGLADASAPQLRELVARIGHTPLQPLTVQIDGELRTIYLKLESANPTGSVKDRTAAALIQDLEQRQLITAQSTIIESTSGNLGVALALICRSRGYPFIAVVDPRTTPENMHKMRALGARVDLVTQADRNGGYLLSRLEYIQTLLRRFPHYVWSDQYANQANPRIHALTTGPEIYRQMQGKVELLCAAVSTGGTLAGIGAFFRRVSPATRIVGVDACGSVVFGTPSAPRKLTGIGSSRPSDFLTGELYDEAMQASDEEAFAFCHELWRATGLKLGGSSGAVLAACVRYLHAHREVRSAVCVCPDHGDNYASTLFSEQWLQQQAIQLLPSHLGALQTLFPITVPPIPACD
ncbi:MAG TPA: pyridoxal-phosphate dependent enzyme [Ktedonobacteraceae bacterium]|nr:pyridoxal-phosphate dependent enzyme [Ktedonobacteraceae bacterium]